MPLPSSPFGVPISQRAAYHQLTNRMAKIQQPPNAVNFLAVLLMLCLVALILGSFFVFSIDITITIILLVGIWAVDHFFKNMLGLGLGTSLADFSFACLVFVGSRGVSLLADVSAISSNLSIIINIFVISFVLLILWSINISLSIILEGRPNVDEQRKALITSILISTFALILVLGCQYRGLI